MVPAAAVASVAQIVMVTIQPMSAIVIAVVAAVVVVVGLGVVVVGVEVVMAAAVPVVAHYPFSLTHPPPKPQALGRSDRRPPAGAAPPGRSAGGCGPAPGSAESRNYSERYNNNNNNNNDKGD